VSNSWAKSDVSGNVLESLVRTWGLWKRCQYVSAGINSCDTYDRFILGSPWELTLGRIFVIFGLILGVVGFSGILVGADCATLQAAPAKKTTRKIAAITTTVAGTLICK
jgi:claudin